MWRRVTSLFSFIFHCNRRRELGVSGEESEMVLLTQFVNEILPLLRETWVELVVSSDGESLTSTLLY